MELSTYRARIRHDNGKFYVTTCATSISAVIKIIMEAEKCPENAIQNIENIGSRTARQWLTQSKELPSWVRKRALEAISQENINKEFRDMKSIIFFGITWDNTREGADFWLEVYNYLTGSSTELPKASSLKKK